jgi:hypothetical protein
MWPAREIIEEYNVYMNRNPKGYRNLGRIVDTA